MLLSIVGIEILFGNAKGYHMNFTKKNAMRKCGNIIVGTRVLPSQEYARVKL